MKESFVLKSYINHFFKSKSKFKIHSPFIYNLITKVLNKEIPSSVSEKVKKQRKNLYSNKTVLEIVDFGAGSESKSKRSKSSNYKAEFTTVKKIAKNALLKPRYSNLLYNLVSHTNPKLIVELGTSLGITTSMLALASPSSKLISLEGCASISAVAQQNLKKFGIKNVSLEIGEFGVVLPEVMNRIDTVDFVFFDGNHRKQPTIDYFEKFLDYKNNETIFVFDDIHWSKGMGEAWEYIKNHPETVVTLDLFQMGIVFFRKELSPQHFVYRF